MTGQLISTLSLLWLCFMRDGSTCLALSLKSQRHHVHIRQCVVFAASTRLCAKGPSSIQLRASERDTDQVISELESLLEQADARAAAGGESESAPQNSESQRLRQDIDSRIQELAPSDLQVRLKMLGFTPWTIAGYVLAIVIIVLNNVLGTGWAGDLLGMNQDAPGATAGVANELSLPGYTANQLGSDSGQDLTQVKTMRTIKLNAPENIL
jgi:hypothetical protein